MTTRVTFQEALGALRANVDWLGALAQDSVRGACAALLENDPVKADGVVAGDIAIDELFVSLEEEAYFLIARQAPVAADLRFLVSALRVMADWERMGGLAVWVAKIASESWPREPDTMVILKEMADRTIELVGQARQAWRDKDLEIAAELTARDGRLDDGYQRLTAHLRDQGGDGSSNLVMHALMAGRHIERIADHAVAVGDRVTYMLTGKAPPRVAALAEEHAGP